MEVYRLPCAAEEYVSLALYTNVSNARKLKSLATSGHMQASLLEPTLVRYYNYYRMGYTWLWYDRTHRHTYSLTHTSRPHTHFTPTHTPSHFTQVTSTFHVLCAVYKAVAARERQQMKTRSVYSEIIFALSPSTNVSNDGVLHHMTSSCVQISESFKKLGIKDTSPNVMLVALHSTEANAKVLYSGSFPWLCQNIRVGQ